MTPTASPSASRRQTNPWVGAAVKAESAPVSTASTQSATSPGVMKGLVHCSITSTSTASPEASSNASQACSSADSLDAWSPDNSAGRRITTAPSLAATAAMRSSSVDTATASTRPDDWAARIARATSGTLMSTSAVTIVSASATAICRHDTALRRSIMRWTFGRSPPRCSSRRRFRFSASALVRRELWRT